MLRVGLSVITVLLFIAMGVLLYTGHFITEKKPDTELTAPKPTLPTPPPQPEPAPTPAPIPAPPPIVQAPPPPPAPAPRRMKRTHVVQSGESLSSISRKYFGTPDYYTKIAEANNLKSRDKIRVGQVLVLPDLPMKMASAEVAAPIEASAAVEKTPDTTETPAEPAGEHRTANTQDFEPQQPTLNIKAPKK
jgi:LysM repeat protein